MAWKIKLDKDAEKDLKKIDKQAQRQIFKYLRERIEPCEDPCAFGKALGGNLSGLWRYRVENYRLICRIDNEDVTILVIRIGHRKKVYI